MGRKAGSIWRAWTDREIAQIRAWAGLRPISEIARELGRSEGAVAGQARVRGISLRVWR
jgi:hypothetical protein